MARRDARGCPWSNSGSGEDARTRAAVRDPDHALVPAVASSTELIDRQRVEELVRDDDARARPAPPRCRPCHATGTDAASVACWRGAQHRAGLDQMHRRRRGKIRQRLRGAQRVGHQRAAARPELDQPHVARRAHRRHTVAAHSADQLAEHLADLGRGDEIAAAPERIARHVVAVLRMAEAERHVVGDRHRPVGLDDAPDLRFERRHAPRLAQRCSGGRRIATTIIATPNSSIGIDSTMPMVSPPHRKPICGSGSRNNSQNDARERIADREGADDEARPLQRAAADQQRRARRTARGLRARPRRAGSDGAAAARRSGTPSPTARRTGGPRIRR